MGSIARAVPGAGAAGTLMNDLVDLGGGSVGGLLRARSENMPDKLAVICGERAYTYAELDREISAVGAGLLALGLSFGDNVGVFLPNSIESLTAWWGANRAGMVQVPVNTAYKGDFLERAIRQTKTRVLVTTSRLLPVLQTVESLPEDLVVAVVDAEPGPQPDLGVRTLAWTELLSLGDPGQKFPAVAPSDTAGILLTSGTTGYSKGVVVPHLHNVVFAREAAVAMGTSSRERLFTNLPLFHGAAQMQTALHAMYAGATLVIGGRFSASRFWEEIRACRATQFNALGSVIQILLTPPESERDRDHDVQRVFAAPAPPHVLYRFEERFNVHIVEGYGLTEVKNILYNPLQGRKVGSLGKPTASSEIEVHDEQGTRVPPGQVGEIVYRPRRANVMFKGYLGDPGATVATMADMWWHTGDLGYTDADGFFYFIDRKKDALRRSGENISSREVEAVLNAFPGVLESVAVAVPSDMGEDEVLAVLSVADGVKLDYKELFGHCDRLMPYFMVPRYYRATAELPRTLTGKVRKVAVRAEGTEGAWDSRAAGLAPTRHV
jgi:crotonobetaine/carnitine-CoA ligase